MIKNIGILSGIISSMFILLYTFLYVLRDLYSICNNKKLKLIINKSLPIFTKYNTSFLLIATLSALFHIASIYNVSSIFYSGYFVLFIMFFILKITFLPSKKSTTNYNLNSFAYLLCISLIFHLVFK
ncbi:hypothetical protein CHF27_000530 [Romboutsia maritimum]|uniref:Uncharacterized protein n=1 Tax=Romboutsia maritimum TaxID=2020948 RepID=A0A371IW77_9FIRM|nr:hypothetical protein CHF27_000530 [Romboutsia maritimum]